MLGQLENWEEYNNAGALFGLDGDNDEVIGELMGELKRMNPIKRQKVINKLTAPSHPSKGSRAEFEKHFIDVPEHIRNGIIKKDLRLADIVVYSIKPVTSRTIKMFETQDDKEIGLRNISNAKLPKNQALLVSGIFLLVGTAVDGTKDKIMSTNYDNVELFPAIANGEFSLKANKKQIVPETSNAVFKTKNFHSVQAGYFKLANPRLIVDDILIEMTIELGTNDGIPPNTHIWVGLHGTITTP